MTSAYLMPLAPCTEHRQQCYLVYPAGGKPSWRNELDDKNHYEQTELPGPIEGSYPNGQPYNTSNVIDIATPTSSIIYRAREREGCTNQIHSIIILVFFELHIQC
jgi:hypothetical protein